jgi:DNA polymerase III subunit beta
VETRDLRNRGVVVEFSADTKSFADALEQIQGAVEKKSTIPILSHALVEASATGLQLAATDLELGIRVFCPASAKAPGHGAIPARRLLEIVRSLPDGEVRLRALDNHWVQIGSGRSMFKLTAMAKDNFRRCRTFPKHSLKCLPVHWAD